MAEVGMLGSGSWGTALAVHLARLGHRVALWARKPEIYWGQVAAASRRRPHDAGPAARSRL